MERRKQTTQTKPAADNKRTAVAVIIMAIIVALPVCWHLLAPAKATPLITLDDLDGVWKTDNPAYRSRYLQFRDGVVTFGQGDAGTASYRIDAIESEPDGGNILVRIRYRDLDESDYQISFYYHRRQGGTLWMKNQKGVPWSRTRSGLS